MAEVDIPNGRKQLLATVVGCLIVAGSFVLAYWGLVGQWVAMVMVALGAGLVFPQRIRTLAETAKDLVPWRRNG